MSAAVGRQQYPLHLYTVNLRPALKKLSFRVQNPTQLRLTKAKKILLHEVQRGLRNNHRRILLIRGQNSVVY